jgi:hypothetical protein
MTDSILCRCLACKNPKCRVELWLPVDALLRLPPDPADPSKNAPAIALLCHYCTKINRYSLAADSSDRAGEDRLVSPDQSEDLGFLGLLKCEEESCKSPLPLVETWSHAKSAKGQYAQRAANKQNLGWENLTCANGHPVLYPQPS